MSFGISIGDILKLCELAGRVYKNCRDCTGEYKSLATEARSLTNLLDDIQDKFDKIPESKHKQLYDAYEPCLDVLQELDKLLTHYNSLDTKSKRAWDRLKWDPDKSRTLRGRLTSSVSMLNAFYTSMIHDSQVLILEALGRLELDYRGGHREESIASLERITSTNTDDDDEDDVAWTQILRDLEDVGVAKQDALSYRDMIIDWLVAAVNEGRLLEQREPESLVTMPQDMRLALPTLYDDLPGSHHLDVPEIFPGTQRSHSAPYLPPSSMLTPLPKVEPRATSIPSTPSLPAQERSQLSSYAASCASETDTSSLYTWPKRGPTQSAGASFDTQQIKRVPVPTSIADTNLPIPVPSNIVIDEAPQVVPQTLPSPPTRSAPPRPPIPHDATFTAPQVYPPEVAIPEPPQLPSYLDKANTTTADMAWTAQQIIAAWTRRDFTTAGRYLEDQLAAVERGYTVISTGAQPDRRVLRFFLGICASYTGDFTKAKKWFESVFNGIYLHRANLDDGDIAAARWLGDACLHLREHQNAVLAWCVAFEGSLGRYGIARDRTQLVLDELRLLDRSLFGFQRIESSFQNNVDPTDIFRQTHAVEKSNLISTVRMRLHEVDPYSVRSGVNPYNRPEFMLDWRPKNDMVILEGFLLGPLISSSAWPMSWDATFSPSQSVQLDRSMNTVRYTNYAVPLLEREIPTASLGASKQLHFLTRRGSQWLIETVKQGLQSMCIEHAEHAVAASIVCCLNQSRDGYTFSEGVEICFKKLQFRNVYGLKITDVKWATRLIAPKGRDTEDFREILKSFLEDAENAAVDGQTPDHFPKPQIAKYG